MAHYAFLNEDNIVTEVIAGIDESETIDGQTPEDWYSWAKGQRCVRTSYNARIRKNYAGPGFTYHEGLDAFVPPQCHQEATLNDDTARWDCTNEEHNATPN